MDTKIKNYKNILLVTSTGLGDFIMETAAIALLKKSLPQTKITVILNRNYISLSENNPVIDRYIPYFLPGNISGIIKKIKFRFSQIFWILRYLPYIYFRRFDACVFLDDSLFFTYIAKLSGIKILVSAATSRGGKNTPNPFAKHMTHLIPLPKNSDTYNLAERYQTIIRSFLSTENMTKTVLPDTKYLRDKARALLAPLNGFSICLCFQSLKEGKYPFRHISEFVNRLDNKINAVFYIVGTKDNFNQSLYEYLKSASSAADIRTLCGKTSLLEIKSVLEECDLLITVDSGIMHLAAAAGTKTVSVHGQSLPQRSGAMTPKAISLCSYEDCASCVDKIPPQTCLSENTREPKCLNNVKPQDIASAAIRILEKDSRWEKLKKA